MLRYETKVVKIYFFAFKLTRKKKHHRKLEQHHIHHSGAKYISDMRIDPHRSHILSHNSLMWEASVTGGTPACFRWIQKRLKQEIQPQCPADIQYPHLPKAGTNPTQTVPKNIVQYSAFFTKTISVFNRFKLAPILVQLCRPKFQINKNKIMKRSVYWLIHSL